MSRLNARVLRGVAVTAAAALAGAVLVAVGGGAASAVTNPPSSRIYEDQTFYSYVAAGETFDVNLTRVAGGGQPVTITVTDPVGAVALTCTHPGGTALNTACAATGLSSTTAGAWKTVYDITTAGSIRYTFNLVVRASGVEQTGRTWTTRFGQYQSNPSTQTYWIATREGYLYSIQLINFNGIGSALRSNGFGLVEDGTCTPIYRSAEGTSFNANGVPLEAGVEYSDNCGDDYLLFFEAPSASLPATAASADGPLWVRPTLVPPAATDLEFIAADPLTRAGEIHFDLAGVNGGYQVQIDTNADGDYTDPTDRVIPWGSPPGAISVPFDGLDGAGDELGVCQPMNARVVVDRVGETHFVLEDVEMLGNGAATAAGLRLTGLTPGVIAPAPLLYWDDTALPDRTLTEPFDGKDGTAGFDTTVLPPTDGAHGWRTDWGDIRSIENWTYYQAEAGAEVAIEAPCNAELTIDKIAELNDTNENGFADVGETIDYSFLVSNVGNAYVFDVSVDDPDVTGITPASADLSAGSTQLFTAAPYVVTQADVDAGSISNTATASGTDPEGTPIETPPDSTIVLGPERDPGLTIDKVATTNDEVTDDDIASLGETVSYSFTVTNTGNVTLTGVSVEDDLVTGITPAPVTLEPGESQVFTADAYAVTQGDMNTGSITNTAFAIGTAPTGDVSSPPDTEIVPTPVPDPLLELEKTGELLIDADSDGFISPGDTIEYTFEVTNTGTVDLTDVSISDPHLAGPASPALADIAAGGSQTYTGTAIVQQSEQDAGVVRNTATASGTYDGPDGDVIVDSAPDTVELPTAERAPGLTIEKSGALDDTNSNGFADVGEQITYSFLLTNTGNTTLENVAVIDERVTGIDETVTLPPGTADTIVSDPYTVTQADVDAGGVANTAVGRGNVPGGPDVTTPPDEEFIEGPPAAPELELVKTAALDDANENGVVDPGESIVYSFVLTNTGNVSLFDVVVNDPMLEGLLPGAVDVLAPGVSITVAADAYEVASADFVDGEVVNTATALGTPPGDEPPVESNEDSVTLPGPTPPTVTKPLANTGLDVRWGLGLGVLGLLLGAGAYGASRIRVTRAD